MYCESVAVYLCVLVNGNHFKIESKEMVLTLISRYRSDNPLREYYSVKKNH